MRMSDDVLVDLSDAHSTSDDTDAVNTQSARVYFGPLQSPEKKFTATRFKTPVRRSARLSSTRYRSQEQHGVEPGQLRSTGFDLGEGTSASAEEDMLHDEPSFVLANKVLSAHSNPSPPPSPPPGAVHNSDILIDLTDSDIFFPTSNSIRTVDDPSLPAPPQQTDTEANTSQPDLITFDSFSTPSASPRIIPADLNRPRGPPSQTDRTFTEKTVDDLLSLSPQGQSDDASHSDEPFIATAHATTPSADEEDQVLDILVDNALVPEEPATHDKMLVEKQEAIGGRALEVQEMVVGQVAAEEWASIGGQAVADGQMSLQQRTAETTSDDTGVVMTVSEVPTKLQQVQVLQPDTDPHTPVRRSTRKRSSVSPARPRLVSEAAASSLLSVPTTSLPGSSVQVSPAVPLLFPQPSGVRVKKRINSTDIPPTLNGGLADVTAANQLIDERRPVSPGRETNRNRRAQQHRRLGSLSPTSTGLLMQLLSTTSGSSTPEKSMTTEFPQVDGQDDPPIVLPLPSSSPSPTQPNALLPDSQHPAGVPPSTPLRATDPTRTPARRIPIAQAIAQGTYSPPKPLFSLSVAEPMPSTSNLVRPGAGLSGTSVFKRPAMDDPNRSPARRVPISQVFPSSSLPSQDKGKMPMRLASPTRLVLKERARSNSIEPVSRPQLIERSRSAEPSRLPSAFFTKPTSSAPCDTTTSSAGTSTPTEKTGKPLPFPLTPLLGLAPPTIPEVDEGEEENHVGVLEKSPPTCSPAKAVPSLRQPSTYVTSRIPRIGAKPYGKPNPRAREPSPTIAPTSAQDAKPPPVPRRAVGAANGALSRPFRALQAAGSGSSSSDDSSPQIGRPGSAITRAQALSRASESSRVTTLKRKREAEKSLASPPGAKPVVPIRKVVPGMFAQSSRTRAKSPPQGVPAGTTAILASPPKAKGPIKMRKVADWKPPPRETKLARTGTTPSPHSLQEQAQQQTSVAESTTPERADTPPLSCSDSDPSSTSVPQPDPLPPIAVTEVQTEPEAESQTGRTRRSSRSRKAVSHATTDVFGAVAAAPVRPLSVRRKRLPPPDTSAFAGMTAIALRALTSSNTQKNQQQVASLKTEVIRKEGKRPGSPTTKIRTVLEKQKEVKAQQRQERAERRARRSSEASAISERQGDISVDMGDVSAITVDDDGIPVRHRRGPGDEEDYETPPRPERPFKRERLDVDVERREGKRVKWDRGLATIVYLDDSPPRPRTPTDSETVRKGCLTTTAKSIRLDTLGNVLEVNAPLLNLVREDVIVKKFVYDDDGDAQPDLPEPEPEPEPVETAPLEVKPKSRSKKSKT